MTNNPEEKPTSAEETLRRFGTEGAAQKYATLEGTAAHEREARCIRRAFQEVPPGSRVLDLPCGTGRMLPLLLESGFRVVEADASPHMVEEARRKAERGGFGDRVVCRTADIFDTPFEDGEFDALLCNRLFHHFREPRVRCRALRELDRICAGPLVVSFFCFISLDGIRFHLKSLLKRQKPLDRIPIGFATFRRDIEEAGLHVLRSLSVRPGISPQRYVVLVKKGRPAK